MKDDILLPQATSRTLIIPFIGLIDIGEYECIPRNEHGTFNTSRIRLDARGRFPFRDFLHAKLTMLELEPRTNDLSDMMFTVFIIEMTSLLSHKDMPCVIGNS